MTTTAIITFTINNGTASGAQVPTIQSSATLLAMVGSPAFFFSSVSNNPTSFAASGLPPGLTIDPGAGTISGTPTSPGTFQTVFSATNSAGTANATIEFIVSAQTVPFITSASSVAGVMGAAFNYSILTNPASGSYGATNLPAGLAINPATGIISGTPSITGVFVVPISATNAVGTSNATLTITLTNPASAPAPVINSAAEALGTVGASFFYDIYPSGTNYATGSLPPGLMLDATDGYISGTPTAAGTYTVPISVTNAGGTANATLTIVLTPPVAAPVLSGSAVVDVTVNSAFSSTIGATGSSPIRYSATGLPAGVTFDPSTGLLSGTITAAGNYPVPISASNSFGTSNATLTIEVAPVSGAVPPVITSAASAAAVVGVAFRYTLLASGSPTSYTLATVPAGFSFNSQTGVLSGTPTAPGTYSLAFAASNSAGTGRANVSLMVAATASSSLPVFTSAAQASGAVDSRFSYTMAANNNGVDLGIANLPDGLEFSTSPSSPSNGTIFGSPTTAGTFSVTLTAKNAFGTGTATLTITIAAVPPAPPVISTSLPLIATYPPNSDIYTDVYASGNPASFTANGLPPGVSIDNTTGEISGTVTAAGVYPATITVTNGAGSATAVTTFLITAAVPPPAFTNISADYQGYAGVPFQDVSVAVPGIVTSYAATGLPPGLVLDTTYGLVSGTPNTPGTYSVTLSATNSGGTGTAVWTLLIADPKTLQPAFNYGGGSAQVGGTVGQSFYAYASASVISGGNSLTVPLTYTFSGLPSGLTGSSTINSSSLAGIPTTAGIYPVTITATTAAGESATEVVTLVIGNPVPPVISSAAEVYGSVGNPLQYGLSSSTTVIGFGASNLPPGLTLTPSNGVVSGTPTTAGTYQVNVSATDGSETGTAIVTFVISAPLFGGVPVINSAAAVSSADDYVNSFDYILEEEQSSFIDYFITAINGATSFTATNLPVGLSLNTYTGEISGVPLTDGVFRVPITATNSLGSGSATLTIIVTTSLPSLTCQLMSSGYLGNGFYYQILGPFQAEEVFYDASNALTFTATGLPPGLSLDNADGFISGTLTQAGTFPVLISARNRAGTQSALITITVVPNPPPSIIAPPALTSAAAVWGFVGIPLNYSLDGAGATYTATGLPAGLSLNATTGVITGTPRQAGTFSIPVSASNSAGSSQAVLTLVVDVSAPVPLLGNQAGAPAFIGSPFSLSISTTNFIGAPAVSSYGASNLPAGLSLNAQTGFITGTPTGPTGTYVVPLSANVGNATGTASLTLTILPAVASTAPPALGSPAGTLGFLANQLNYSLGGTGFVPTSALPAGLSFNSTTGEITGYPTSTGTYQISLAASASTGGGSAKAKVAFAKTSVRKNSSRAVVRRHPVQADNSDSNTSTAVLTLSIINPTLSLPRFTSQPVGGKALQNGSVTLSSAAVGVASPAYQWLHNGMPVAGATSATLTLTGLQPTNSGVYTVTGSNTSGQVLSSPATLTVDQTYETWQTAHFTANEIAAGLAAENYDANGDGLVNLLKYALGIDPINDVGGGLPVGTYSAANGALQLVFTRDTGRTDLDYVIEDSPDLEHWTQIASSSGGSPTVNLGGALSIVENAQPGTSLVNVVVEDGETSAGTARRFLRLQVVGP